MIFHVVKVTEERGDECVSWWVSAYVYIYMCV